MPCNCGGRRAANSRQPASEQDRPYVDPTRAMFAAAMPTYTVVPRGGGKGRRFSTQSAAEDYARRTGGTVTTG